MVMTFKSFITDLCNRTVGCDSFWYFYVLFVNRKFKKPIPGYCFKL